jgi:hypothetical protein
VDVVHLIEPRKDSTCLKLASEYLAHHPIFHTTHYLEGDSHAAILEHAERERSLIGWLKRWRSAQLPRRCWATAAYLCSSTGKKSSFVEK